MRSVSDYVGDKEKNVEDREPRTKKYAGHTTKGDGKISGDSSHKKKRGEHVPVRRIRSS